MLRESIVLVSRINSVCFISCCCTISGLRVHRSSFVILSRHASFALGNNIPDPVHASEKSWRRLRTRCGVVFLLRPSTVNTLFLFSAITAFRIFLRQRPGQGYTAGEARSHGFRGHARSRNPRHARESSATGRRPGNPFKWRRYACGCPAARRSEFSNCRISAPGLKSCMCRCRILRGETARTPAKIRREIPPGKWLFSAGERENLCYGNACIIPRQNGYSI